MSWMNDYGTALQDHVIQPAYDSGHVIVHFTGRTAHVAGNSYQNMLPYCKNAATLADFSLRCARELGFNGAEIIWPEHARDKYDYYGRPQWALILE